MNKKSKRIKRARKVFFTWDRHAELLKRVEEAGKRYYAEAEKIEGSDRAAEMFTAAIDHRRGLAVDPRLQPFIDASDALNTLKEECVWKHNLDISLVALAILPNEKKFDLERNVRKRNFLRSVRDAKKQGIYGESK